MKRPIPAVKCTSAKLTIKYQLRFFANTTDTTLGNQNTGGAKQYEDRTWHQHQ